MTLPLYLKPQRLESHLHMQHAIKNAFEKPLKANGFVKKGGSWYRDEPDAIFVADWQKSNFGKQYYVNLAVWVKALGKASFPKEHVCHIRIRLGQLMKRGSERLFDAEDASISMDERTSRIVRAIETRAITFLTACRTVEGILRLLRQGRLSNAMVHWKVRELVDK